MYNGNPVNKILGHDVSKNKIQGKYVVEVTDGGKDKWGPLLDSSSDLPHVMSLSLAKEFAAEEKEFRKGVRIVPATKSQIDDFNAWYRFK